MGEGEKEQANKSNLGQKDKARDLQAMPGGVLLGGIPDQAPSALLSQVSPETLQSSSRQVSWTSVFQVCGFAACQAS